LSNQESDYSATRYVPALKTTLEALLNEELSFDEYPSVTPMPASATSKAGKGAVSARSGTAASLRKSAGATSRWNKSSAGGSSGERSTGPTSFMGSRTIVFMLGGLCYPELRVAREIMEHEGREIIMGSTAFLSAKDFIEDLGNLAEKHQM
jgi:syntaxin-binding protein 1